MGRAIEIIRKFPKFVLAGTFVFNTYVGEYMAAPVISFECAVFANYCTAYFFVWGDRSRPGTLKRFFSKYALYNLSASGAFLIKMCFLLLFELLFRWDVVICSLAALCISGLINFSMGEWVIFRRNK